MYTVPCLSEEVSNLIQINCVSLWAVGAITAIEYCKYLISIPMQILTEHSACKLLNSRLML